VNRRAFLFALAGLVATPLTACSQHKHTRPTVGLVFSATPVSDISGSRPTSPSARGFLDGLRALGWIDGQNITIERRSAGGRVEQYLSVVQEMVKLDVDALVLSGAPSLVLNAARETRTIPIVMAGLGADPVELGLVKSLARPGGNVTGSTFTTGPGLSGKRLELLKELAPAVSRVVLLTQPDVPAEKATRDAARAMNLTLLPMPLDASTGIRDMFASITKTRGDALVVGGGAAWGFHREIIEFAAAHRLPAIYVFRDFTEAGGLMSYGADYSDIFRRAANYVSRILKGEKPADLPIEQPTKFELVVNVKTAKALRLTLPPSLLLQADQVIDP